VIKALRSSTGRNPPLLERATRPGIYGTQPRGRALPELRPLPPNALSGPASIGIARDGSGIPSASRTVDGRDVRRDGGIQENRGGRSCAFIVQDYAQQGFEPALGG
jgi:hypothetical protein